MKSLNLMTFSYDFGQPHSGVAQAADYLTKAGLIERLRKQMRLRNFGDTIFPFKKRNTKCERIIDSGENFLANRLISETIERSFPADFQLNIGGDHGMGLGTVHAALKKNPNTIIIWADAHGDINTPATSPSGNFHGMPLAFLLGEAEHPDFHWQSVRLPARQLILIGPRDLDQGEKDIIARRGIQYFSSAELNRIGAQDIIEMALHRADPMGSAPIHLSFDVDLFDAADVAATGTKVNHGPRLEEVFLMGGLLAQTNRLVSMDIVEFNPDIGSKDEAAASALLILDYLEMIVTQLGLNQDDKAKFLPEKMLSQLICSTSFR